MTQVRFEKSGTHKLSDTKSICPECNVILPAIIFERDEKIWISKECSSHGYFEDLYFGSIKLYQKFKQYAHNGKAISNPQILKNNYSCPKDCGLCGIHLSHTALANLVVTNRCDLTCWYCFFYAKKGCENSYVYEPTLEQIRDMAKILKSEKPVSGNAVQITGGEPSLRDDLIEIIKILREENIEHLQLNTNGIRLARDRDFAEGIKNAGINTIYMSFDGVTSKTNPKNHWEVPYALDNCRLVNLGVVLVPTIMRTINEHELGNIIRYAEKNIDVVRSVNFQPVSLVGRIAKHERMKLRITIPDCIKFIEEQTQGDIPTSAWFPVPACIPISHFVESLTKNEEYELSNHFACGAGTYVFQKSEKLVPITSFVDIEGLLEYLQDKSDEIAKGANKVWVISKMISKIGTFIDKDRQPPELKISRMLFDALIRHNYDALGDFHNKSLFLGMMHFQDKYNHDVERVKRCNIHYLTPDKSIIPFCSYNVIPELYRDMIHSKYGISIEKWENIKGKKFEDSIYDGKIRKLPHHTNCGCQR